MVHWLTLLIHLQDGHAILALWKLFWKENAGMRPEEKKQVERCIVLPLAYQAIQIDKKEFEASYAPNP